MIGATGTVGREVVAQLSATGAEVHALARHPDAVTFPEGVARIAGDLTIPESLDSALDGADAVFLVWTAPSSAIEPALERVTRAVRRVVYLSAPLKTPHPFFQQPNPARAIPEKIERLIEGSAREWTFIRPGMFAANSVGFWADQIRRGDVVRWPYLDASTAPIGQRDIAEVSVHALCKDGHAGAEYVITGPESLTQREQIETIAEALGRSLQIEELTRNEARRELLATFPAPVIEMLLNAWEAALGQPAFVTSTVFDVTGHPARTFRQWVVDNAVDFIR